MSRSTKTNLILALVLVIIGSIAGWYEYKYKPAQEAKKNESSKILPEVAGEEIASVAFTFSDATKNVEFTCKSDHNCKLDQYNSRWDISKPTVFRADEGALLGGLSGLANTPKGDPLDVTLQQAQDLEQYGLVSSSPSFSRVDFKLKSGRHYQVLFGSSTLTEDKVYTAVLREGESLPSKIYFTNKYSLDFLKKTPQQWRFKRIVEYTTTQIEALNFEKAHFSMSRKEGEWYLSQGSQGSILADFSSVDEFLNHLIAFSVTDYVSDDKARDRSKFKISQPSEIVELSLTPEASGGKGQKVKLALYANHEKAAEYFVERSDQNFLAKIDKASFDKLQRSLDSFRLKHLIRLTDKGKTQKVLVGFADGRSVSVSKGDLNHAAVLNKILDLWGRIPIQRWFSQGQKPSLSGQSHEITFEFYEASSPTFFQKISFYSVKKQYFAQTPSGGWVELGVDAKELPLEHDQYLPDHSGQKAPEKGTPTSPKTAS